MHMMHRAAAVAALVPLLAGAVAPVASASTSASTDSALPLEYSVDGVTWAAASAPLLPPTWRPVPGSTHVSTFYLRSAHDSASNVAVFLDEASSPSATLLEAVRVTGAVANSVALDAFDRCRPLQTARLAPGESLPVTATVTVDPSLTTDQRTSLKLSLAVAMSDTSVTPRPAGCQAAAAVDVAPLALTGQDARPLAFLAALGAVGVVLGIVFSRRRRESGHS